MRNKFKTGADFFEYIRQVCNSDKNLRRVIEIQLSHSIDPIDIDGFLNIHRAIEYYYSNDAGVSYIIDLYMDLNPIETLDPIEILGKNTQANEGKELNENSSSS
jgi:hypothetical protein